MPNFHQNLRQISSSQVLQRLAHERSWLAAVEVTKSIVIHLERKQLLIASEEVSWLGVPLMSIGKKLLFLSWVLSVDLKLFLDRSISLVIGMSRAIS